MATPFEFYFDFSSPYAYCASTQVEALASEFGRSVRWRPILLGAMFKTMGSVPLAEVPLKGPYSIYDFARTAELFDIPFVQPPKFPTSSLHAARAMLWIEQNQGEPKAVEFAHAIFRAYFVEQHDINDLDVVKAQAIKTGVEPAQLAEGIGQQAIKTALKDQVDAALERGVFGAPFIFVDNEPFWGFDRFDYIRRWLLR
jgi:2-hydroxychromene-2-carboxylate isomerase